jgi:hypothetical protein
MSVINLSTSFALGGFDPARSDQNVLEVVTAETDESVMWWVVTRDGHGELLNSRQATETEWRAFELAANPPPAPEPAPEWSAFVGTLTADQRSALTLALGTA